MQLHDQKTAGIPGLLPLFLRMRARVTEKIDRGKDIHGQEVVILKRTSCEVQGWDLHTCDRVDTDESERMLHYLHRVLFIKFPGTTWQIHKDLEIGVFPLRHTCNDIFFKQC